MPLALPPRSAALFASLVALGCRTQDPETSVGTESTVPTASTGDTAPPVVDPLVVSCSAPDHAFRGACSWRELEPPGQLTVDGVVDGEELVDASGSLPLYDLSPDTMYTWRLERDGATVEGSFRTPRLPSAASIQVTITGTPSFPIVGLRTPCGYDSAYLVLDVDPDLEAPDPTGVRPGPDAHRVVGYEYLTEHQDGILEAVSFTEDDTVLGLSTFPGGLVELDHDGQPVLQIAEESFFGPPHHDVFRRDGLTYLLVQEFVDGVYLDAVQVFDASGSQMALWRLADHLEPVVNGKDVLKNDYSHANSIWVDDQGDWYLSSRHLSAVFKIAGLDAPDAGDVRWILAGDPDETRLDGTLQLLGGESFVRQHNVHLTPEGKLALFDNRLFYPERSRLLWLDIDEKAGTASVDQAWTLPYHCPFQGGAWTTASGTALATCAPRRTAFELQRDQPQPVATIEVACTSGDLEAYVPRFVPLEAW